ncbi:MAG: hypothetical protein M3Q81_05815 [bacterium]|nr:hypothetical protein [bacterium]
MSVFLGLYAAGTFAFWRYYSTSYSVEQATEWQYGYKEMIAAVEPFLSDNAEINIYISRQQGRPAAYLWFYTQQNPLEVQAVNSSIHKDQGEFLAFKNVVFFTTLSEITNPDAVIAASMNEFEELQKQTPHKTYKIMDTVSDLTGETIWVVVRTQP